MHNRKSILTIVVLLLMMATTSSMAAQMGIIVETDKGKVFGIDDDTMLSFLGIPYAKPPIGELRWRAPVEAEPWSNILDATKYASQCAQNNDLGVFAHQGGSEDCLYLNVFVNKSAYACNDKLPVFVWIHGGALQVGAGSDYNPVKMVSLGEGIVVTLNYRLGLLGFFSHPAIDAENTKSVNYGFMDQNLALEWVRKNIAAFGGDPDNITIAGESSGAHSVFSHIVSPYSAGKFQYAITMSGGNIVNSYPNVASPLPREEATKRGLAFAREVGCETAQDLRNLPLAEILKHQAPYLVSSPIIDGDFLPIPYAEAFKQGRINQVTLINGNTLDEGTFFTGTVEQLQGKMIDEDDYPLLMQAQFGAMTEDVMRQYPLSNYINAGEAYAAAVTDAIFACPALRINELLYGKIPVYAYEFADRTAPSYLPPISVAANAAHTSEIPYLFVGFNGSSGDSTALNPLQEKLSDQMVIAWTRIKDLHTVFPEWKVYDPKQQNILRFTLPHSKVVHNEFSRHHNLDFWNKSGLY